MNKKASLVIISLVIVLVIGGGLLLNSQKNANSTTKTDTNTTNQTENLTNKTFSQADVTKHDSKDDCWTIIDGNVYELSTFIGQHPGGDEILRACGKDATKLFHSRQTDDGTKIGSGTPHSSNAENELSKLQIGKLSQ